ncbi:MAG: OmpA family protein [Myxococcales bacterium]|nr:OmpA family protein [Myxococcales bacterium]
MPCGRCDPDRFWRGWPRWPFRRRGRRRRAAAVVRFLVERHGVAADRLSSEGYGETRPIADNRTSEGRARNRRVVFQIVP